MIIPKIIFKYSWIYDQLWKYSFNFTRLIEQKKIKSYHSEREIISYIKKIERLWRKDEKQVLQELSKVAHLYWCSKTINCYIVGKSIPFSDPLTLPYTKSPDCFMNNLIHELIHILFVEGENLKRANNSWLYLYRKHKNESEFTKIHILLYAIHLHIYLKFYHKKRLKRDANLPSFFTDFKKSWAIVQKEGHQEVIQEFVKGIK